MAEFQWRYRAKIVAILDLVLLIVGLLGVALMFALLGLSSLSSSVPNNSSEYSDEIPTETIWIVALVIILIMVPLILLQIWLNVRLLKSTNIEIDSYKALKLSRTWLYFNAAFAVLNIFGIIKELVALSFPWSLLSFIVRLIFLYIVYSFTKELDEDARKPRDDKISHAANKNCV